MKFIPSLNAFPVKSVRVDHIAYFPPTFCFINLHLKNPDNMLIIILVLLLIFGGGFGGYYGYNRYGPRGGIGIVGLVILIILLVWLFGGGGLRLHD
jgi:drug/metabolite transporter (DMT)-like permease